jgi:hypothetical protein
MVLPNAPTTSLTVRGAAERAERPVNAAFLGEDPNRRAWQIAYTMKDVDWEATRIAFG